MSVRYLMITGVALLLTGCGLFGQSLENRATDYYNHLAGHTPKAKLSGFLSPARQADLGDEGRDKLDGQTKDLKPAEGNQLATREHVLISEQGGFAYTLTDPVLGAPYRYMQLKKWVKVGRKWYIYSGSTSEVAQYGEFPTELMPPSFAQPAEDEAEVEEGAADPVSEAGG